MPLVEGKQTIWDQLALKVTKFRSYLEFVQEIYEIANKSTQKCKIVVEEPTHGPIETTRNIIEFMNFATKSHL